MLGLFREALHGALDGLALHPFIALAEKKVIGGYIGKVVVDHGVWFYPFLSSICFPPCPQPRESFTTFPSI